MDKQQLKELANLTNLQVPDLEKLNPAQRLNFVRNEVKALEEIVKSLKALESSLEYETLEYLTDLDMERVRTTVAAVYKLKYHCAKCDHEETETVGIPAATVFPINQTWARFSGGDDDPAAFAALESLGLGAYIKRTVNTQSLSAWYREKLADNPDFQLPDFAANYVTISPTVKVGLRKA